MQEISTARLVGPLAERVTQLGLIAFTGRHGRCADRLVECHSERNGQHLRYKDEHSLNGGCDKRSKSMSYLDRLKRATVVSVIRTLMKCHM